MCNDGVGINEDAKKYMPEGGDFQSMPKVKLNYIDSAGLRQDLRCL